MSIFAIAFGPPASSRKWLTNSAICGILTPLPPRAFLTAVGIRAFLGMRPHPHIIFSREACNDRQRSRLE